MKKITFENLVSLAQQELTPEVDVTDSVILKLADMAKKKVDPYRAYTWVGAASAAAAACILIAATVLSKSSPDPVSDMMTYVSWVGQ